MCVLRVTYSRIFSVCPEECRKISALTNGQVLLVLVRLQLLSLSHFGEREMEGFFVNSSLFMSCHLFTIYLPFFFFSFLLYRLAIGGEPCPVIRITHQLLVNALQETRPSVSPSERKRYERMYNERELTEDRCSFVLVNQTNQAIIHCSFVQLREVFWLRTDRRRPRDSRRWSRPAATTSYSRLMTTQKSQLKRSVRTPFDYFICLFI